MTVQAVILVNHLGGLCEFRDYARAAGLQIVSVYTPEKDTLISRMGQDIDNFIRADDHSIFCSHHPDILAQLEQLGLSYQAVIPCHECGAEISAVIAKALALTHNKVADMLAARDKRIMRQRVADSGLRSPAFTVIHNEAEIDSFLQQHDFPLVVKTPLGGGTSNVYVCRSREDVIRGFEKIQHQPDLFGNKSRNALLETYLEGQEVIIDGFCDGNEITIIGVWEYDKISTDYGDNLYYNIIAKPVYDSQYQWAINYTKELVEIIGIRHGMFHCELKLKDQVPTLIEIGARLPGWGIPELYRDASNFDPWKETMAVYTRGSRQAPLSVQYHKFMAMAICPTTSSGKVADIRGVEEIIRLPSYQRHLLKIKAGDNISPTCELYDTPLEVCLAHENQAQLMRDVERVHEYFDIAIA